MCQSNDVVIVKTLVAPPYFIDDNDMRYNTISMKLVNKITISILAQTNQHTIALDSFLWGRTHNALVKG